MSVRCYCNSFLPHALNSIHSHFLKISRSCYIVMHNIQDSCLNVLMPLEKGSLCYPKLMRSIPSLCQTEITAQLPSLRTCVQRCMPTCMFTFLCDIRHSYIHQRPYGSGVVSPFCRLVCFIKCKNALCLSLLEAKWCVVNICVMLNV